MPGQEAGEVSEREGGAGADAERAGEMDPMSLPIAAVALGGEEIAGDQCGRLVLQRQEPARAAAPVETGEVVVVPTADGFVRIDPLTGLELGQITAAGIPSDGVATVVGPVVVLRLDDGVRGYR